MGRCRNPRRSMDVQADVALVGEQRGPGMHTHPHAHLRAVRPGVGGDGTLGRNRGGDRGISREEDREVGVALRVHLGAAGLGERRPQQPALRCQDRPVGIAERLQQARRSLDVGEQEAHRAVGERTGVSSRVGWHALILPAGTGSVAISGRSPTVDAMSTEEPGGDAASSPPPPAPPDETTGTDRRKWLLWGGIGFVVAILAGVGIFLALRPDPVAPPVVAESEASEVPSEPTGFTVTVADVAVESTDNATLTAEPPQEPDSGAVDDAVEGARGVLEAYLNAMFSHPDTRFGPDALDDLLTRTAAQALEPADSEALGVIDLEAEKVAAGQVEASASVVADSEHVDLVTFTYDATIDATAASAPVPLSQSAQMVFVADGGTWKVAAVDATLDVPEVEATEASEAGSEQ